jgi:hypothetical protein
VLVVVGVVVNLWGAITFNGVSGHYFFDGFFPAE